MPATRLSSSKRCREGTPLGGSADMGRREAEAAFGAWELVEARASHADDHHPQQLEAHKAAFDRAAQEYYEDQIIKTLAAAPAQVHCAVLTVPEGRAAVQTLLAAPADERARRAPSGGCELAADLKRF